MSQAHDARKEAPRRVQEEPGHELAQMRLLTEPVAQIAIGQELRASHDSQIDRAGRDDLPAQHGVRPGC